MGEDEAGDELMPTLDGVGPTMTAQRGKATGAVIDIQALALAVLALMKQELCWERERMDRR
jgi:hypothetical protein